MKRKHLLLILLLALGVPMAAWAQNTLVPYSEDFESYTNASIGGDVTPTGWTITKGANTVCEVVPVGSGKQLRIGSNGVSGTTLRTVTAKLPTFTSAAKYLKITLKLKANHTQGSALAMGYYDRTGAFNALQTFALNDYQTITTVTVDFNRLNVSNSIVIQYQGITANALWFIDDVQVEFRTKTPNDLAASDVTGSSAHLSWSLLGNAESYQVQYADNASFSNAQTATASNTSVTLSNLSCVTEYYARVRSVYGSATNNNLTYSEWSNVVSFTTSCATPTDVQVMSDLGETTVTWTGNAPSYHIQYKNVESIFGLPKQITYFPDPFTTNPSYTFDGSEAEPLLEGCKYQLRINAQCNPETSSEWSEWIDFQTACPGSLALPLHEHFDYHYGLTSNTENNLPSCWNYINTTTDGNCMYYPLVEKNQSLCHSSYPNSGQYNYVRFHIDVNSTDKQEQYLILPAIDVNSLPDGGVELGFYLRPAENASAMYLVGLMSSPNDPNTFESLYNYWQSSTEYIQYPYTFTKAQMQQFGSHIAIVAVPHETATISFCIDDIDIYPANYICYIPGAVHTTEVTPNSAQITWMPGGTESLWGLQYKKSTDSEWTAVYDPGLSSTNCTLTDLEPNTTYNVRVRSWCNTVDYSDWNSELTFTTLGLVPTPGNFSLDATATGSSYVKILWSAPEPITGQNAVAGYEMQISEDGVNWENVPYGIARNEGYAVFDLIEPRTHYVRVRAQDNQANYGPWSEPFSFTISPCSAPTSLTVGETVSYNPLVSSATPHLPDCWTISDPNDKLTLYTSTNTLGFDGRSTGVAYAIMPAFNATTACDYTVSFEWMHVNTIEHNTNAGVSVQYSLDGSQWHYAPSENIYVYDENIDHNFQFVTKSVDIPAHSQTVYVRFEFQGATEGTGHICEMRNVAITAVDACPAPTGLTVSDVTSTGANFTWNAESGAAFEYYTVSDPYDGFLPPTDNSYWTDTQNNTVGWTNAFSPNSVVRFYLRKNCGSDCYSDYTYVEFRTLCGPVSLADGYTDDFNDNTFTSVSNGTSAPDGYPDVSLPYCWQFLNRSESTSTYPQAFLSSSSACAVSGNCLLFKSSSTTPLYAILPEFVQNISEYQLTFTYRNEGLGNLNGTLYVGYMTNPSDASTFVQTLACTQTTTMTEKTAYFPNAPQGSFMAFKYVGGTNDNCYLGIDNVVVSNGPSCFPTGTLSCGELSAHTAQLSWDLIDETQDTWVVEYSLSPQFLGEVSYTADAETHEDFVLTGLEAETQYYARVRGNCGEGSLSDVSNTISFTTLDACPVPTNLVASNLTQVSADLSWAGSVDVQQYQVWFRRAEQVVGINEQFNTNTLPDRWERKQGLLDNIMNGTANLTNDDYNWYMGTTNGVFDSHAYINIFGTSCKDWLITPSHNIQSGDVVIFDLALTAYSGGAPANTGTDDRFVVLVTIDNGQTWTILREWNNSGSQYVYNNIAHTATGEQVSIDLTEYAGWDVRIAFYGESTVYNADNNLHIDNVKIGTEYAAGGGNIVESQTTSVQLVGLEANMIYDVQVRSICSDTWTDIFNFKTLDQNTKVFIGGQPFGDYDLEEVGDKWWNPYNWVPYGMPSSLNGSPKDDVILRHDAVIAHDFTTGRNIIADANSITFEGTPKPTLTIEDGNQLWLNTNVEQPDVVTVKKSIIGYAGTKDQYYLISSPANWAGTYNPVNGIVTTESDYDLYDFDPSASDGLEWRNYKAQAFSMQQGEGYLYANAADVQLRFTGPIRNNRANYTIWNMSYDGQNEYAFNGWDLCGNPFTCNAYLSSESQTMAYYRMNAEGTGFEAVTSVIKPMEGFFLQNTVNDESVVLSRTAPSKGVRCLNLVLGQVAARRDGVSTGSTTLDNAIVRFDEGNTLEKLSFREGSSKVYMPVEGKDYAVVNAGQVGELPLSFKAEKNGTYTLSFSNENVEFGYLHLIDNLTGAETNLLATPSYTFEARTTDYASRFRLVFASVSEDANGDSETFAFNNNGNWIILNEGRATLQVIDLTGRILSSEQIEGSVQTSIHQPAGLYLIRLVNGDEVKVQKVVVR